MKYYFNKRKKKDFFAYGPQSLCSGLGLNLGPSSFLPIYVSNYLSAIPTTCFYSAFMIAYNRRFDYKLFLTLFYCM